MSSVEDILEAYAERHVSQDEIRDANKDKISKRVKELLSVPEERNPYMWEYVGVIDINLTWQDYELVQVKDRNYPWNNEKADMYVAALYQAVAETCLVDILNHSQDYGDTIEIIAAKMSPEELKTAAKQGVGNARRDAAKQRRSGNVDKNID